jgi:chemotaxis family two-component system sensor kinase Cph1
LGTLQRLTQRMEGLIEALLRYSRLGRQDLERHDTNLQELLDEAIELLTTRIRENGVTIRQPRQLPFMQVDRTLVGELFVNLITNAIKYNDKADRWVEIGWTEDSADGSSLSPIAFYVRDNGIGISRSHHENVFRIFKRLHAREDWGGGAGVGLTIVRRIIERHGGRIWLESEVDAGTTFYFTLDGGKEKDDWNRDRSADVVAD